MGIGFEEFVFMLYFRGFYFQVGENVTTEMSIADAYKIAIETLARWVDTEVNTTKTSVFFRTYSPIHFRLATQSYLFVFCSVLNFKIFNNFVAAEIGRTAVAVI